MQLDPSLISTAFVQLLGAIPTTLSTTVVSVGAGFLKKKNNILHYHFLRYLVWTLHQHFFSFINILGLTLKKKKKERMRL
ncbi:hypothetical protein CDO73_26375 [Saccharibacillus sp. O23]|nr:hypothetical protein CDO73_26380 [Saccharibacillus sp. O23]OWR25607.1 hypothetical protein CDO73_26375 [Saccharibacillus sp. O23]